MVLYGMARYGPALVDPRPSLVVGPPAYCFVFSSRGGGGELVCGVWVQRNRDDNEHAWLQCRCFLFDIMWYYSTG